MLTQKSKYGLRALLVLAKEYGQGPVLISDIAHREALPQKFLELILLELRNHGILGSKKGKGGGYFLSRRPELVHLERIDYSSDHAHGKKVDGLRRTRSYQPVLTDVRSIAPTGWYGSPQHATIEKSARMLQVVADSIAKDATEVFRQLDILQGGIAELKNPKRTV